MEKSKKNRELLKPEALLNILEDLEEERDKVKRSSEEWSSTFNAMTDMISVHDKSCVILKVNKAFAEAFKGKPEDFVGKKCYNIVHHTEKQVGLCPLKETLKTKRSATIEIYEPVLKKYLEISTVPLSVNNREIGTVIHTMRDITERKKSAAELIKNKDRLEKAQEIGLIGTWNLDILKNKLEWTKECYKIFGVKQGFPMNLEKFFKIVHPDDRGYVSEKWDEGMKGEEYDIEHRILVSKKVKWVREKAELKLDKSGNAIHAVGITQDITERKKAEEELIKQKNRAQMYLDLAGVMIINLNQKGEITLINKKGAEILEAKQEEIIGKNWFDNFLPKSLVKDVKKIFSKLMLGEGQFIKGYENPVLARNGKEKIISWHNTLLKNNKGKIIGILSSGEDITEKKKAEEELKKSKEELEVRVKERTIELEKANKELKELDTAKTDFLNTISHELKTPLTAMIAHLDVMGDVKRKCINRGVEQKQCGLSLDAIKKNNSQLNFLIDNLLEVARMQSKTFKLDVTKFNIRELLLEVVNDFLPPATQKGLKIYYSVDKSLVLRADRNRVKEILNNLIDNAVKFTEKGKIMIRIKRGGEFVSIAVEDSGIGIGKEDMPNLFKKFFQVKHGLERGNGLGTGLGLTIINKLAQLHGGKVFVKSQLGKGSTFTVKLPIGGPVVKKVVVKKVVVKLPVKGGVS